jgi:hypothetical protein
MKYKSSIIKQLLNFIIKLNITLNSFLIKRIKICNFTNNKTNNFIINLLNEFNIHINIVKDNINNFIFI